MIRLDKMRVERWISPSGIGLRCLEGSANMAVVIILAVIINKAVVIKSRWHSNNGYEGLEKTEEFSGS